ncbi:hypothetical protein E4631_04515 [Hymenobacter sp. UV11]|uniref:hypothetical protein n=1 Tax=Hymenobacter sp. UV11 TaxID=1849735 RepID=UPI0010615ADE|nr:hypothetical protein [Hymenobacter sp. UV11]TDN35930.1 hypothetical protein A8B98_10970 [Hymenobacter sp. UV11]TFZ68258.1 hypothetical protein E4631_04515 [Hymenobacter sp. UV11]
MKIFLFASVALGLTSCLNVPDTTCESTVVEPVLSATGPKTVAINQPATFALAYQAQSACGKLSNVVESTVATPNTRVIGIRVNYTGCNCPQTTIPSQASYTFQPTQAGTYYLQFVVANGYLTDTLVVK